MQGSKEFGPTDRTFALTERHPNDFSVAVDINGQSDQDAPGCNLALVAHADDQRLHEDEGEHLVAEGPCILVRSS